MEPSTAPNARSTGIAMEPLCATSAPVVVAATETEKPTVAISKADIEHAPVQDDPRKWSRARKVRLYLPERALVDLIPAQTSILFVVSFASAIAGLGAFTDIFARAPCLIAKLAVFRSKHL
jgi:hypothetical protein